MCTRSPIDVVGDVLSADNPLGIEVAGLDAIDNPHGEGKIVFVPTTRFIGVLRTHVWCVIDDQPFALNAPAKYATPTCPWPREAPAGVWERFGMNPYQAMEALAAVWDYDKL